MHHGGMLEHISNQKKKVNVYEEITEVIQEIKDIQKEYSYLKSLQHVDQDMKFQMLKELAGKLNDDKEELHNLIDRITIE